MLFLPADTGPELAQIGRKPEHQYGHQLHQQWRIDMILSCVSDIAAATNTAAQCSANVATITVWVQHQEATGTSPNRPWTLEDVEAARPDLQI